MIEISSSKFFEISKQDRKNYLGDNKVGGLIKLDRVRPVAAPSEEIESRI